MKSRRASKGRGGLGEGLARRWAKASRSAKAPARQSRWGIFPAKARSTRSEVKLRISFVPEFQEIPEPPAQPEPAQAPVEVAPVPVPQLPVPQPQPGRAAESDHGRRLFTGDLIRPSASLRSSLEGFFLDQRSPHTQKAYARDFKRFVKYLLARAESRGPDEVLERAVLVAYKDSLVGEGLEHTTVDRHLATLRSLFGWLVEEGRLERSPADGVRFLKPRRVSRTLGFTDEEVRRVLIMPNLHSRSGAQHYAILMTLFYCGLRRSELCALRTSHLTLERGHRVLRLAGKGNRERIVVLPPAVWNGIRYLFVITRRDLAVDQYLFTGVRGKRGGVGRPLDSSMIYYIVTRYARLAGIQSKVSPHSCRATAISNARDRQVPDRAIQEFAGWSSTAMIVQYDKRRTAVDTSASLSIDYGKAERPLPAWQALEQPEAPGPEGEDLGKD